MKHPVFIAAEFPKGNGEIVKIALDEYRGRPTIDIRVWHHPPHGEPRPGSKGLTTAAWHLAGIKRGIDAAYDEAVRRGIIVPVHLVEAPRHLHAHPIGEWCHISEPVASVIADLRSARAT